MKFKDSFKELEEVIAPQLKEPTLNRPYEEVRPLRKGFYVASRASIPERAETWRAWRASGVKINSTWIDEAGEGETADLSELWSRIEREIRASTALILYVEPDDFPLKGALVEVGIALGCGIPIRVVAPGVVLDPQSCRPIGSWIKHPLVTVDDSLVEAFEKERKR